MAISPVLDIGISQRVREVHYAFWVRAMLQSKCMAELVHRFFQRTIIQQLIWLFQAMYRNDRFLPEYLGNAEYEIEGAAVEVDVRDGKKLIAGLIGLELQELLRQILLALSTICRIGDWHGLENLDAFSNWR